LVAFNSAGQVVEVSGDIGVLGAVALLIDRERAPLLALHFVELRQVMKAGGYVEMLRPQKLQSGL
jgi:hypothetical protein